MNSSEPEIAIHYYKKDVKFNDLLVILTHPTVGMVSSIVGSYLIDNLNLELIGALLHPKFHPTAVIHNGTPLPPIRIYAGDYVDDPDTDFDQIAVISSDLPLERDILPKLADRLLEWADFNNCRALITIEGMNKEDMNDASDVDVFNVVSNDKAADFLKDLSTKRLTNGMVSGLSGLLLYKANIRDFPVINFLSEANPNFPDSRSAAAVLSVLNKLVPKIDINYEPLLKEAEKVEAQIQKALSQIGQPSGKPEGGQSAGFFA